MDHVHVKEIYSAIKDFFFWLFYGTLYKHTIAYIPIKSNTYFPKSSTTLPMNYVPTLCMYKVGRATTITICQEYPVHTHTHKKSLVKRIITVWANNTASRASKPKSLSRKITLSYHIFLTQRSASSSSFSLISTIKSTVLHSQKKHIIIHSRWTCDIYNFLPRKKNGT